MAPGGLATAIEACIRQRLVKELWIPIEDAVWNFRPKATRCRKQAYLVHTSSTATIGNSTNIICTQFIFNTIGTCAATVQSSRWSSVAQSILWKAYKDIIGLVVPELAKIAMVARITFL